MSRLTIALQMNSSRSRRGEDFINRGPRYFLMFLLCCLLLKTDIIDGFIIKSDTLVQTTAKDSNSSVSCTVTPPDANIIYIKWWYKPENYSREKGVYTYVAGKESGTSHSDVQYLQNRTSFLYEKNSGKVHLFINNTQPSDSGTYICEAYSKSQVQKDFIVYNVLSTNIDTVICHPSYIEIKYSEGSQGSLSCIYKPKKADIVYIKWWYKQSNKTDNIFGIYTYSSQDRQGVPHSDISGLSVRVSMKYAHANSEISLYINNTVPEDSGIYECRVHGIRAEKSGYIHYQVTKIDITRVTCSFQKAHFIGESVKLTCNIKPSHSSIVYIKWWFKYEQSKEEGGLYTYIVKNSTGLSHSDIRGMKERISMEYQKSSGTVVLTVNNLTKNDTGIYICEVFSHGSFEKDFTQLLVIDNEDNLSCSPIYKNFSDIASALCVYGASFKNIDSVVWRRDDTGDTLLSYRRSLAPIDRDVYYSQDRFSLEARLNEDRFVLSINKADSNESGLYSCEISDTAGYNVKTQFRLWIVVKGDGINKKENGDSRPVTHYSGHGRKVWILVFSVASVFGVTVFCAVIYFMRSLFNNKIRTMFDDCFQSHAQL